MRGDSRIETAGKQTRHARRVRRQAAGAGIFRA